MVNQKNKTNRNLALAGAGAVALWFLFGGKNGEGAGEGSGSVGGTDPTGGGALAGNYIDDYGTSYALDPQTGDSSLLSQTPPTDGNIPPPIGGQTFAPYDSLYPPAPLSTVLGGLGINVGATIGASVLGAAARRAADGMQTAEELAANRQTRNAAVDVGENILGRKSASEVEAAAEFLQAKPRTALTVLEQSSEFAVMERPAAESIQYALNSEKIISKGTRRLNKIADFLPIIDLPVNIGVDYFMGKKYPQNLAESRITLRQAITTNLAGEAAQFAITPLATTAGGAIGSMVPVAGTAIGAGVGILSTASVDIAASEAARASYGLPNLITGVPVSPEERQQKQEYVGYLLNSVPTDSEGGARANTRRQVIMQGIAQTQENLSSNGGLPNPNAAAASIESNKLGYDPSNPFNVQNNNGSQLQSRQLAQANRKETTNAEKGRQKANKERLAEAARQKAEARANALRTFGGQYGARRVNASRGGGFTIYSRTAGRSAEFAAIRARNKALIRSRNSIMYNTNN